MEIQKYDRENNSIIIRISVDELEVLSEALRLSTYESDELTAAIAEQESTAEGIVKLAYYTGIVKDILKTLPGEIDAAIEQYRKLED